MKKILIYMLLFFSIVSFSGCLKEGLPAMKNSSQNAISGFDFEFRWLSQDTVRQNGAIVDIRELSNVAKLTNMLRITNRADGNDTVYCQLSIPSQVPSKQRINVKLTNIWAYAAIPDAATITPLNGSPALGKPGDFSKATSYKVTAADGSSKSYTVVVAPLPIVNQWEGLYHSTGHFDHPTSPRDLDLDKYYSSVDATTITGDHSDLGSNGYTMNIKINSDNTCIVTQYASGSLIGEMVPGAVNKYDPATKTFTLNYRYMGSNGYRTISETLKLK
jgi:hypothetical protein